mgnify:CR=1 FL=1
MIRKALRSKRGMVRAASLLIAAFVIAGGLAVKGYQEAATYRWHLQTGYQHSFAELTTAMEELDTALQKGVYATSPCMLSSLLTQIYGKAMTAQLAVGQLPYSYVELEQTASFVAKTGDYALALSRSSTLNDGINQTELEGLRQLASLAGQLSQNLQNLQSRIYDGALKLEDVMTAEKLLSQTSEEGKETSAGSSFQTMEADFPEIPSLIYDGPFSEHLTGRAPVALEGLAYVTESQAAAAAGEFLGMAPEAFALISAGEGTMSTWGLSAPAEGGDIYVEVTQTGGKVVSLFTSSPITESIISKEDGVSIASAFLSERGFRNMADTYWIVDENKITVNFCPLLNGILIYPDLIRVTVSLDDGDVVGFEASGYLSNHRLRDLAAPAVSPDAAQQKVSKELKILSTTLALIPTGGEYEVLCQEFKCETPDGRHVIVYVNVLTGEEEKILLLLEDESGTLVI